MTVKQLIAELDALANDEKDFRVFVGMGIEDGEIGGISYLDREREQVWLVVE